MSFRNFHIDARLDGASLSQALKQLVPNTSWTQAKRLIANRHVQVHGNLSLDEGRRVKAGDVVKVWDESLDKPPAADDLSIVYRDAHLAIVEKPAGVTTQREARDVSEGRNQKQATLDELLTQALARLPRVDERPSTQASDPSAQRAASGFILKRRSGADRNEPSKPSKPAPPRVRPVHRLDRDTSGLMLFALSPEAETKLVSMFKKHEVERAYRAIVIGSVARPMTIDSYLVRDRGDGLRGSSTDANARDRQRAVTHVKPLESIGDGAYTVVECRLETGRTHQIRIHLAERGHVLCGEKTYIKPLGDKLIRDPSGAPRHALHSATLALKHPITGEPLRYQSEWPRDLSRWLERLRNATAGER